MGEDPRDKVKTKINPNDDPLKDVHFCNHVELWERIREGIHIPRNPQPPSHGLYLFCFYMGKAFEWKLWPLAEYKNLVCETREHVKPSKRLIGAFQEARRFYYDHGMDRFDPFL